MQQKDGETRYADAVDMPIAYAYAGEDEEQCDGQSGIEWRRVLHQHFCVFLLMPKREERAQQRCADKQKGIT